MRLTHGSFPAIVFCAPLALSLDIQADNIASLTNASSTITYNLLSIYATNTTGTPSYLVGTLPQPLYWWHAGAVWGSVLDYWAFTNDTSYNPSVTQALITQAGPEGNLMPQQFQSSMGNDDIAFWGFTVLSAMEYDLPFPSGSAPAGLMSWLQLAERVFNGFVGRWDTTSCGGGLKWQLYPRIGYNYKNAVSNGGFFLISARLWRFTGNSTYLDWANKIWDWSSSINLVDRTNYAVYDGSDDTRNCPELEQTQWTYNAALYLGGAAYLHNASSNGSIWSDRASKLLIQANMTFFGPFPNATKVIFEQACELRPRQNGQEQSSAEGGCDQDQVLFKAFLARWLGKTAILAPFLADFIKPLLRASVEGAAVACSGFIPPAGPSSTNIIPGVGINGTICAQHFFLPRSYIADLSASGYFSSLSPGQKIGHHLSAVEMIQASIPLVDTRREAEGGPREIRVAANVTIMTASVTSTVLPTDFPKNTALSSAPEPTSSSAASSTPQSGASNRGIIAAARQRSRMAACLAVIATVLLR